MLSASELDELEVVEDELSLHSSWVLHGCAVPVRRGFVPKRRGVEMISLSIFRCVLCSLCLNASVRVQMAEPYEIVGVTVLLKSGSRRAGGVELQSA